MASRKYWLGISNERLLYDQRVNNHLEQVEILNRPRDL